MADYAQTLADIYSGGLLAELSEKLTDVVKGAEQTGKQGSITLTLKIKTQGNSGQVEINPVVKTVVPEFDKGNQIMFATPEGNLQLQDPRQKVIDFKTVERAPLKMASQN